MQVALTRELNRLNQNRTVSSLSDLTIASGNTFLPREYTKTVQDAERPGRAPMALEQHKKRNSTGDLAALFRPPGVSGRATLHVRMCSRPAALQHDEVPETLSSIFQPPLAAVASRELCASARVL